MSAAILLASLLLAHSRTTIPFSGPGVNSAGQFLPVDKLKAIGIRWIRADLAPREVTERRMKKLLEHYKGMPILWMLSQQTPNAPEVASNLVDWGFTDIECGNETELGQFNIDRRAWSGAAYARWFNSIKRAVGTRARLYGPVTCNWNPTFVQQAIDAGMHPDAIAIHGYGANNLDSICDYAKDRWKLPVIVSEVGPDSGDAANAYLHLKNQMGDRPWCWYDGPAVDDWRGLFNTRNYVQWTPTPVYNSILRRIGG